ncbi:MAG TPA: DHA2 family efflux MFS transporter permease subunit [Vicinamibacterales bacterium]|nr:DHA2 family efflux MFS transporter permease subunit [Vicinamibacterales bacterium]
MSEHKHVNPWIVAIAVMFATFMEVLDTTVVNVSLPHIAGNLSATIDESTWVLTSYLVANAIVLPMTGWLARTFGRKHLLMASVTGFTIASLLCGLAPNLPMLVFFRLIQGATGGAMQPLSQAVLLEAFRPEDRGKAMGFWGLGIVVAPILGPVLGGWLTDTYSWRWVFYINLPVGITSIIMTQLYVFDPSYLRQEVSKVDYWGIGLLALWIGCLQIALDLGQEHDWFSSHFIAFLVTTACIGVVVFIIREWVTKEPIVDLHIFKDRTYSTGVFLMTTLGFVLYGSLVLLPIMLQTLLGYPALQAGIAMAPRGVGSLIGMPLIGLMIGKIDARKLIAFGLIAGALTLIWLGELNLNAGYWDIFWPQFFQGLGLSALFVPLTTASMDAIPRERMGNATSLFNLMRNLGGSIGIAVTGSMLARNEQFFTNVYGANVDPYSPSARSTFESIRAGFIAAGADITTATERAYAALFGIVQQQAAMSSFVRLFRLLGIIFLVLLPLVLLMKRPRSGASPGAGAH